MIVHKTLNSDLGKKNAAYTITTNTDSNIFIILDFAHIW